MSPVFGEYSADKEAAMLATYDRKLILESGEEYLGYGFGQEKEAVLEVVFNTSMVGYQEILSDPSYTDQAVVFTYPLIGNYGMAAADYETLQPSIGALIVREYNPQPSNFRSVESLDAVMKRFDIPGIYGLDTRKLTRSIRDEGSRRAILTGIETSLEEGLEKIRQAGIPHDAVSRVSCREVWNAQAPIKAVEKHGKRVHVAAIDCGMKRNIYRMMNEQGMDVTIFPWDTPFEEIERIHPDGIFVSNGPGDPEDVTPVISLLKKARGKYPIFGICLGMQMIALAYGAKTYKLTFGHRGGNHPVMNLSTGKVEITSQNHSYAVDEASLEGTDLKMSHKNLLDGTVEGIICEKDRVFAVQYHPESAPGPQDSRYLFTQFAKCMTEGRL